MNYKNKKYSKNRKKYIVIISLFIVICLTFFAYFFDKRIFPSVLKMSEVKVKAKVVEIINETSLELLSDEFSYNEMMIIDRDSENNISLIRANTIKLNYLSSKLAIKCNNKLDKMGKVGIEVPLGWISDNSTFYELGPDICVNLEPVGNLEVEYNSIFESAGINQTRHIINLEAKATVKIEVPLHNEEIIVTCTVPIADTIIIGKIPSTAIDFGKN